MRRAQTKPCRTVFIAGLLFSSLLFSAACSSPATEQTPAATGVTVFEGARLIVGDGSDPIDNGVFLVEDGRIRQVGRAADVQVPEGATRVALAGKTVMPAIIDTHIHARSQMRET